MTSLHLNAISEKMVMETGRNVIFKDVKDDISKDGKVCSSQTSVLQVR